MVNILGQYINGNYKVTIFSDGTKIRETEQDDFVPSFAENCDVKITDYCDGECPWCYEGCSTKGKHADLLSQKWVDTLHPFTELALNGNDLSHPQFLQFLHKLKEKNIITNLTVSQKHFMKNLDKLHKMVDEKLIYGLGISLLSPTDEFIKEVREFPNAVVHVINGILTSQDIYSLMYKRIKILILGYKELNRGSNYLVENSKAIEHNQYVLKSLLPLLIKRRAFTAISFDNLAIEQLNVRTLMSKKDWEEFYMGDDGNFTFYIDMVNKTFSKNSISPQNSRKPIMDNVDLMFNTIRSE